MKKLQKNPLYGPLGVFSFLAVSLAFSSFWLTHRSQFVTPGVFGGPVALASEMARSEEDPSVNEHLAVLTGFAPPTLIEKASPGALQEIVPHGYNWGKLHLHNAVDIAAPCGQPILAFAEGIISGAGSPAYWNSGYGGFVEITHRTANGNQYVTKYTHTEKNEYAVGHYVLQGEKIGLVGDTGNVHGPTGCHVHFEVHGAKNPFVR